MGLPENLKELRKAKGITQKQLATDTGLSLASIISYENGLRKPNFKALTVLEEYFGVSGEFLNGTITQKKFLENQNVVKKNLDDTYINMQSFNKMMKCLDSKDQIYVTELFNELLNYISNKQNIDFENHTELSMINVYISLNKNGKRELVNRGIEMSEISRYSNKD